MSAKFQDNFLRAVVSFENRKIQLGVVSVYNQLTQKDIDAMKAEIEYRKVVVRKELLEDVKEARAHGDLSENFEYHAAKKEKNRNESRIRYLERMIKTAEVISDESKDDEIGLNKIVELYFEDEDDVETYKIVTTVRGNSLQGLVSTESPIGKALLGHKVGDKVWIPINANAGYYVVVKSIKIADPDEIKNHKQHKAFRCFIIQAYQVFCCKHQVHQTDC